MIPIEIAYLLFQTMFLMLLAKHFGPDWSHVWKDRKRNQHWKEVREEIREMRAETLKKYEELKKKNEYKL